jgi:CheY-like chemotaxis protein
VHILLADDSVPAQNMGKKILAEAGHDVVTASNGRDALRKIEEKRPDLAILDIFMPGYSGLEICERLRADGSTAALPVVLTVGKLEPYRQQDAEKARSSAVIIKPFVGAELLKVIDGIAKSAAPAEVSAPSTAPAPLAAPSAAEPDEFPDEALFGDGVREGLAPAPPAANAGSSLAFDPDAEHTPFSASAFEAAAATPAAVAVEAQPQPSAEFSAAAAQPGAAVEFNLEAVSNYSGEIGAELTEPGRTIVEAQQPAGIEPQQYGSDAQEQHASANHPGTLEIPEHDPTMELSQKTGALAAGAMSPEEAQTPEMESDRLAAFDALFSSAETLMDDPVGSVAMPAAIPQDQELLPNFATHSDGHEVKIARDEAIEFDDAAVHPVHLEPVVSEADPYLLEEVEHEESLSPAEQPAAVEPEADPLLIDEAGTIRGANLTAEPVSDSIPLNVAMPESLSASTELPLSEEPVREETTEISAPLAFDTEPDRHPEPLDAISESDPLESVELLELQEGEASTLSEPMLPAMAAESVAEAETVAAPVIESEHLAEPVEEHAPAAVQKIELEPLAAEPEEPLAAAQAEPVAEVQAAVVQTSEVQTEPLAASQEEPVAAEQIEPLAAPSAEPVDAPVAAIAEAPASVEAPAAAPATEEPPVAASAVSEPSATAPAAAVAETAAAAAVAAMAATVFAPVKEEALPAVVTAPRSAGHASAASTLEESAPARTPVASSEVERVHQAVERVFVRYKPLLVAAIVRELARSSE